MQCRQPPSSLPLCTVSTLSNDHSHEAQFTHHRLKATMCKSAPVPPQSVTEVADRINTNTNIDNSWSFFNFHIPSSTFTAAAILVIAISAWLMFKAYNRYCGHTHTATPPSPSSPPSQSLTTPPPTTWTVNMDQLLAAAASHRALPGLDPPANLTLAAGQLPPIARF